MNQEDPYATEVIQQLYQKGLSLLARREHSSLEIKQKLAPFAKEHDCAEHIPWVLEKLISDGYLSDTRFADMLLRSRIGKGHGPLRIRQELQHKGVDGAIIAQSLDQCDTDWFALAATVRLRRFSGKKPANQKELGRQMRFLGGRGFSQEQIRFALEQSEDSV